MKKILIFLLAPLSVFANCDVSSNETVDQETLSISTDVPKHLIGAKITITLADGTTSTIPAEQFKVVKRQQQFIVTKTKEKTVMTCSVKKGGENKNVISLMGGYGLVGGLKKEREPSKIEVETKNGPSAGIQYQRRILDRFYLGVQGQTNGVGSGLLGIEF